MVRMTGFRVAVLFSRFSCLVALLFCASSPLWAQRSARDSITFALSTLIPLHEGINVVDIAGDSSKGMFVVGRRENFNAHSSTSFAAFLSEGDSSRWNLLTFWDADKETRMESTSEGADCALVDFRVVRIAPHGPVSVLVARRDFGASYADIEPVHFDLYDFRRNTSETVGDPAAYFIRTRTIEAAHPYCDVDEAFAKELGLGMHGLYGVRFR